jgi:polyisoprenoid-binding protein YceI
MIKTTLAMLAAALFATTTAFAEPTTYTVDPSHTSVTAESRHFGTSTVRTHFNVKSGSITIDPAAKTGSVTIDIDINSIATGVPKLDTHLKSTEFFDAQSYPDATFTAKQITFDGDKVATIEGELTMKGHTNPVVLTATNYNCYLSPGFKKQACGGSFTATIQRSLWDVRYVIPFVPDETKLLIEIEALKS